MLGDEEPIKPLLNYRWNEVTVRALVRPTRNKHGVICFSLTMASIKKSVNLFNFFAGTETSGNKDLDRKAKINGLFRGVSFSFHDRDEIEFPKKEDLRASFSEGYQTVGLVLQDCPLNGRPTEVPLYALRKTPKGLVPEEESRYAQFRKEHPLYVEMTLSPKSDLSAFVDADLFGRKFSVVEAEFTCARGEGDDHREFQHKIWALEELPNAPEPEQKPAPRRRRK